MRVEERVRQDLRRVRPLAVPDTMADEVLSRLRQQHRVRVMAGSIAAVVALVIAIPVAAHRLAATAPDAGSDPVPGSPSAQPDVPLPRPGGGAKVVHLYRLAGQPYLLDVARGRYVRLNSPDAALSPDLKRVAITDHDGRLAVVDRAVLLSQGEASLQWTAVTGGSPAWSPDGKSVLVTGHDKSGSKALLFAKRYHVHLAIEESTPLPDNTAGPARWTADGSAYLVPRYAQSGSYWPKLLQRVEPDGMPGGVVMADSGGVPVVYSPSGEHLLIDAMWEDRAKPRPPSKIVDAKSYQVVAETEGIPLGWYDDAHYIRFAAGRMEVVDFATGAIGRVIEAAGLTDTDWLMGAAGVQVGPSDGLAPEGATYGF